ncbi:sodium-dependent transporter [Luteimonas sp. RD2P54]|uniref:Transporter n=1 Tax=Luteimonas endophytica TaxID=3042023 RepID=A0ABT6J4N8_9GAMM|nr:sodium-dependent transporter [Luteimonas endophytica]MDH5821527.1 sodium-dependent transporter [Luteimonas endophytica]
MDKTSIHGMWSSRLMFILAATGSAVGLGNIWRFPYMTSDNGGGAFVLVYLGCILLVGLPILMAEILIGRHGRVSPINTLRGLARDSGVSRHWVAIGWIGIVAGILILSFYSVVAGWTLHYTFLYLKQLAGGAAITDPGATFAALLGDPLELTFWHALFMLLTVAVVALGVEKGLERAVRFLMPALFVLLLMLVVYGMTTGFMGQAAAFLFKPDWSVISGGTFLSAMGQAFFTLSLGMCTMMTYGAYLPREGVSIGRVGIAVALTDTSVALLAGLAIFPVVLSFGIDPAGGGPGLIFTSLPLAFESMPFGIVYGLAFFGLLAVAAWTSSISLLEPATAFLVEKYGVASRKRAALGIAGLSWLLGLLSVLSLNLWSEARILDRDIMTFIEFIANDLMLPLGGLLIALFAGWALNRTILREQLSDMPEALFTAWRWLMRVVAPALVLIVLARAVL